MTSEILYTPVFQLFQPFLHESVPGFLVNKPQYGGYAVFPKSIKAERLEKQITEYAVKTFGSTDRVRAPIKLAEKFGAPNFHMMFMKSEHKPLLQISERIPKGFQTGVFYSGCYCAASFILKPWVKNRVKGLSVVPLTVTKIREVWAGLSCMTDLSVFEDME